MARHRAEVIDRIGRIARTLLCRLDVLAFFPLLTLLAVWLGAENLVLVVAMVLPALLALQSLGQTALPATEMPPRSASGAAEWEAPKAGIAALSARVEQIASSPRHDTACILMQIDDWSHLVDRWGYDTTQEIAQHCLDRLRASLRPSDLVVRLGDARFGIVLHQLPSARLGMRDALVSRLRETLSAPIAITGGTARLTSCAGHTNLIRDLIDTPAATLSAAEAALAEAHRSGPNAIRAYVPGLKQARKSRCQLAEEVEEALTSGAIRPWFQPQLRSDTGALSGFEALARWHHPERGVLAPGAFLQAVEDAGRMEALGHTILFHALDALRHWDEAGVRVPSVSVNFSATELRNPDLVDRVKWEIDRLDLRPGRLTVEILETVAAEPGDDAVITTLQGLAAHGVNLDLDDFGIGQASLAAIRRFGVSRIKLDRSFIIGLDEDSEQKSMVAAILSMARHLGVETLAEGVETQPVQRLLAQMGCNHVQGYFIARPMPFDQCLGWLRQHNAQLARAAPSNRRAG